MRVTGGLRKRWIINTVGVVYILGLICVFAVTVLFSAYYYSTMESDLFYRAQTTTDFFADYTSQNYKDYYQSCINYAKNYSGKNSLELQFINTEGTVVASSYGIWPGDAPETSDITSAIQDRKISKFIGKDPLTGERIFAVSSPMIYSSGEVIGVLRYVTSVRLLNRQIAVFALSALGALALVALIVLISSNYYIRTILIPVAQITEKAKRITGGNYGILIQTHYDDEIGELADTINEMSIQINQNEKIQRDFISSLSHELRTPLTAITGWSETLLSSDALDPEATRGVKIILREGQRLTEMVSELLEFNRIQDGRMTLNYEEADIRGEFEDTIFMYSSRLTKDGIQLEYMENDDEIPEITCDPKRLRQVFLNILDNAAKHGGGGLKVEASISCKGDWIYIQIRDHGPGIPEDELPLIKKKFYKGSSKARGTGIGLAVCDEIVLMHNGKLTLENAEGGGTRVTIQLPVNQ